MVYGAALEKRSTSNRSEGSNPSLSARIKLMPPVLSPIKELASTLVKQPLQSSFFDFFNQVNFVCKSEIKSRSYH